MTNGDRILEIGSAGDVGEHKVVPITLCRGQILTIDLHLSLPFLSIEVLLIGVLDKVVRNNALTFDIFVIEVDWQLDETLPDHELVGHADERLEERDCAFWVLLGKVNFVVDLLLFFTILVVGANNNTIFLLNRNLNVDPFK